MGTAAESVSAILADMPAIGKNGHAPGNMGGYAFRSIEDITAALKPLLAKHGLTVIPAVIERRDSERQTSGNKVMFVTDLHVEFTFLAADGSTFHTTMWGQGTDMGDKSPQKAVTSAFKSMLSVVFCISDGNDAEAFDVPHAAAPAARPASKARIEATKAEAADAGIGDWVKDQQFPWPWTEDVCKTIEDKARSTMSEPF